MKRLSIGMRLTLWYLAIFALAQVIFGAGMWLILRESLFDLVDDGLEAQVDDLTKFLQSQPKDRPFGNFSMRSVKPMPLNMLVITFRSTRTVTC